MQPKIKAKVRCSDREVGEVTRVVVDPLSREISHIVVGRDGSGERQVPAGQIQSVTDDLVQLRASASEFAGFPAFSRDGYVTIHEVEIAHLEENLHVEPGEILVPVPALERHIPRRTFFTNMTHVIGALIGLPLVFPVIKYVMKPMYAPFDNRWLTIGDAGKIKKDDVGYQYKYQKLVKEAFMPEEEVTKNVWVVKATAPVLESVYQGRDQIPYHDSEGNLVHTNTPDVPFVAFSGKCPHLGCGYKWRRTKALGEVFLCPCHLSVYDAAGKVLDGPAPRALDPVPLRLKPSGEIEIIDVEYKAGTKAKVRIV